ncbi:hypothetical protein GCM10009820_26090 [Leifsonia soli]
MRVAETIVAGAMGTLLAIRIVLSLTDALPGFLNSPLDVAVYSLFSLLCILMGVEQAKRRRPKHALACFVGAAAWLAFAVLILK